jgi:hypothetical protein
VNGESGEQKKEGTGAGRGLAITALCIACIALGGLMFGQKGKSTDELTTVEIVRVVNAADEAIKGLEEAKVVRADFQRLQQQLMQVAQRMDSVAKNHNSLVVGMQQEQAHDKQSIVLMERVLMRLQGRANWIGAVSAVQVEMAEEAKKAAAIKKKAADAKKKIAEAKKKAADAKKTSPVKPEKEAPQAKKAPEAKPEAKSEVKPGKKRVLGDKKKLSGGK